MPDLIIFTILKSKLLKIIISIDKNIRDIKENFCLSFFLKKQI